VTIALALAVIVLVATVLYTQQSGSLAALGLNIDDLVSVRWQNRSYTKVQPTENLFRERVPAERGFAAEESSGQIPSAQVPELSAWNMNQNRLAATKTGNVGNPPAPPAEENHSRTENGASSFDPAERATRQETVTKNRDQAQSFLYNDAPAAAEKLEFEIYKAIYNRAIRGVEVSVRDGTVYLTGRVATERQKLAAAQAARGVPGVKEVRDQVIVSSPISRDRAG
jgi:hypothetical protein